MTSESRTTTLIIYIGNKMAVNATGGNSHVTCTGVNRKLRKSQCMTVRNTPFSKFTPFRSPSRLIK